MRKLYLTMLSVAVATGSVFAQSKTIDNTPNNNRNMPKLAPRIDMEQVNMESNRGGGGPLWQDDFSNPSTWVIDHDATACDLDWEVGQNLGCGGSFPIDTIQSTTKANGYAMVDSDEYGGETGGNEVEDSWIETADSVDLSSYPNVVIEFETYYRRYNYERCYLVVSTDGTWPELTPDTDISGMNNVWDVFPEIDDVTSVPNNSTVKRINISAAAGGSDNVKIRFHWTGTWGYAWFVDDVKIVEQPANDLLATSAYIGHTNTGNEYGKIPQSQLGSDFWIGGAYYNFGYQDQTNTVAMLDVQASGGGSAFSASAAAITAMSDSTYYMDEMASPSGTLAHGVYEGTFTVELDQEGSGSTYWDNNTYLRNFEVTEDRYAIDGVGVHPTGYENVISMGTNSFTDAADGFMMLARYDISQEVAAMGAEILLSSTSVAGGSIVVALHDTADVLADDVTLPLEQTDVIDVTQTDIDNGMITVMFEEPYVLDPNGYFLGVEMFSNSNANDIRILDDISVTQPFWTSVIYIPNDQVYTNPNAPAIRLITADNVGINELDELSGISIYPNPTNGIVNIRMTEQDTYTVDVINVLGEMVSTSTVSSNTTLDLNEFGAGVYVVRVSTEDAAYTERVIVQ